MKLMCMFRLIYIHSQFGIGEENGKKKYKILHFILVSLDYSLFLIAFTMARRVFFVVFF